MFFLSLHDALPISRVWIGAGPGSVVVLDLYRRRGVAPRVPPGVDGAAGGVRPCRAHGAHQLHGAGGRTRRAGDRKSTRLNSSHLGISYAVFFLKKKDAGRSARVRLRRGRATRPGGVAVNLTIREALLTFRRAPLLSALSVTTIAFSLFVVGLFGLVAVNLQDALRGVAERVEIVAYLLPGTPIETITLAEKDIE